MPKKNMGKKKKIKIVEEVRENAKRIFENFLIFFGSDFEGK